VTKRFNADENDLSQLKAELKAIQNELTSELSHMQT